MIRDVADSVANDSIVFNHVIHIAEKDDKIFKSWSNHNPKVDVAFISSAQNTVKLIDVSGSANPDVAASQIKCMLEEHSLDDLAPEGLSAHHCIVMYKGENAAMPIGGKTIYLINIEEFLERYQDLDSFLAQLSS